MKVLLSESSIFVIVDIFFSTPQQVRISQFTSPGFSARRYPASSYMKGWSGFGLTLIRLYMKKDLLLAVSTVA